MKVLGILLVLLYLIWVYFDPKVDRYKKEGKTHLTLWYNSYCWDGEIERKYIVLF